MHGFYSRAEIDQVVTQILGKRLEGQLDQSITGISANQRFEIGAVKESGMSRYRYGQAGGADIALGVLCQSPVPAALQHDLVPSASYAAGTKQVELTIGAANIAVNEYAGGWLFVNDGTGQGQNLRILSHPAALAGATCVFTLIDPITTAFDIADTLCALTANSYDDVIIHPSPPTARLVGVPVVAIASTYYGWFQVRGPAAVLTDGTLYIYQQVTPSAAVDGAVKHAILEVTAGAALGAVATDSAKVVASGGGDSAAAGASLLGVAAAAPTAGAHDFGSLQTIVGKVLRVEADTDYSLIDLALE